MKVMSQARVENSVERSFPSADLIILDDRDCTGSPPSSQRTSMR